jgi:hypothetical protein
MNTTRTQEAACIRTIDFLSDFSLIFYLPIRLCQVQVLPLEKR